MSDREKFEAWIAEAWLTGCTFDEERNCYIEFPVHMAWKGWQASRKQALREAKGLCVEQIDPGAQYPDFQGGWSTGAEVCAQAIERVINPEGELS